jgi:acyl-CoA synthetase (NDP forming)/GNAT superfamily N-acetyltransferase
VPYAQAGGSDDQGTVTVTASVYALLTDGTTAEIRPAAPGDVAAVRAMYEAMSPENSYLRFFDFSRLSAEQEAKRVCRAPTAEQAALLAVVGGMIVGVASYEVKDGTTEAKVAFAVADHLHGRGVGTLLLEHLVSAAGRQGVSTFTASVLMQNADMQRVFTDAGLAVRRRLEDGVIEFVCELPGDDADPRWAPYLDAAAFRERSANVASLRHVFRPASVAVVGASRRMGTAGRAILHNIVTGGFQGRIYAVNPHVAHMEAVPCLPSVTALPEPVDLAVIAVPPTAVSAVADECGRRGVRALVVITAGLATPQGADLLAICRRYGMRLVGPNCFGVAVPGIGLDATFAARHPAPGVAGLVAQSGGLGIALADRLSRLGVGVSSFASVGNKYDISSNDMLMWWEQDGTTKLALLYVESFGNPRKFARTVRRVGRTMPVLTVHAGRSVTGQQASAAPLVSREALFQQAGIIATNSLGELLDVATLLASQPVPAGPHVAVVSNVGGAGLLAADACAQHGLAVHRLSGETRRRLHTLAPSSGTVTGPVDTSATVTEKSFRRCLELVAADDGVDTVLALVLPTAATGDLVHAIRTANVDVPLAAVVLDQAEGIQLLPRVIVDADGPDNARHRAGSIPSYAYPEAAAHALARAVTYGAWRSRPVGRIAEFGDVATDDARALIRNYLNGSPKGGWLPPDQAAALLACYGIRLASLMPVDSAGGTEVIIGVAQEPTFGPLIIFGLGGVPTDLLADHSARLAPLTDTDADELIRSIRSAPLLLGHHGSPPAGLTALREMLLRVSRLADDLPEVADLDLNPVIARPDGVFAVDARIRLTPAQPQDPFLRRLR